MPTDHRLREIAQHQFGLVRRDQARDVGLSRHQLRRLTDRGWVRENAQTLRLQGAPRTTSQRALAAVWAHGEFAALSSASAGAWWGVPGFSLEPLHVIRRRNATSRGGDLRHETRALPDHHVVVHRGVPVTTPARTIFDLAARFHPKRIERALDTMWVRGLIDAAALTDVVAELARRGRRGSTLMRELLAARDVAFRPVESGLERRFVDIIRSGGDAPFDRQVALGDDGGPIGRVDFLDRARALVVETDSDLYHSSPSDRANDARRDARLERAGFDVLRIAEAELDVPQLVLSQVRSARSDAALPTAG
jgi:very-short-patch-repair endonuclease